MPLSSIAVEFDFRMIPSPSRSLSESLGLGWRTIRFSEFQRQPHVLGTICLFHPLGHSSVSHRLRMMGSDTKLGRLSPYTIVLDGESENEPSQF